MAYKVKAMIFLCNFFLQAIQLFFFQDQMRSLRDEVPLAYYFIYANMSFFLYESFYYFGIGMMKKPYDLVKILTIAVQMVSAGLMVWGMTIWYS